MKIFTETFKLSGYLHFSRKFNHFDISWIKKYVNDPERVKSHKFYPFIHYMSRQRRFRRNADGIRSSEVKNRNISYANHLDSCVYSHYGNLIQGKYEEILKENELLNNSVIAYRSKKHSNKNLSNVDLAKDVFDLIRNFKSDDFRVLAIDISSFFDGLDHSKLKLAWKKTMGFQRELWNDHYAVFKNVTKYSYVDYHEVFRAFQYYHKKKQPGHLKSLNIEAICPDPSAFRKHIVNKKLIRIPLKKGTNIRSTKGIPQGASISPVLANIYMLEFDRQTSELLEKIGGIYRRYSDDILLVYPTNQDQSLQKWINEKITDLCDLVIREDKTQQFKFVRNPKGLSCQELVNNKWVVSSGLEYLGFLFNGNVVRLKSASLSKYYRNMKRSISRSAFYAATTGRKNGKPYIFKSKIYRRFSHIGAKRRMKHTRVGKNPNGQWVWRVSKKMDWGNYISYVQLAANKFMGEDRKAIKRQIARHFEKVKSELKKKSDKYKLS